ncbi:MAG: alpha,alpha-trehalase nth1 [Chrysothrix sp. TS-e1954]|nr:MAG: alpha,alpha-trehalase nth1 [Chrysothrix sp. TS-e1954]
MSSSDGQHPRRLSASANPFTEPDVYYHDLSHAAHRDSRNRTFSAVVQPGSYPDISELQPSFRRHSQDAGDQPRQFLIPVEETLRELLSREDTDHNSQITIDDQGPKVLKLGTARSEGFNRVDVRGTYKLSNLLQELTLAMDAGRKQIVLDEARLNENPVDRLARMIRDSIWPNLTRCIDGENIAMVAKDPKDWTSDPRPRVYVPRGAPEQYEYYSEIARKHPDIRLDVQWLSENVTGEYIRDLNAAPGLLAISMDEHIDKDGHKTLKGKPFIVPGGRFNELYGWDSYMASLGLLINGRISICKSMVENFSFCIKHYGKILNANRSYYLGRSQPPFLTDMTLRVYERIKQEKGAHDFLKFGFLAAIKEYYSVWMAAPRFDEETGLSRYRPLGVGVPPETEASHFKHILEPYAQKRGITFEKFVDGYNKGKIKEAELDSYFLHDRAVRESGHDTTYRLEKVAADLATVDLNSCLYKIECDIARTIRSEFKDRLVVPKEFQVKPTEDEQIETAAMWDRRAKKRRLAMQQYMWNEEAGMYFDYNTYKREITTYECVTTFWAMWAGVATPRQAAAMVIKALPMFEEVGGLASGTEKSRGAVGLHRPNRQWDYPFGWAPQQILAWQGFLRYGYTEEAQRLAYKWCFMVTKAFVDFNGVVVEKYDVTRPDDPHKVAAEYGNQGADFKGVPREGFGWVNASYIVGLNIIDAHMCRAMGTMTRWETYEKATSSLDVYVQSDYEQVVQRVKTGLFHDDAQVDEYGAEHHSKHFEHLAHSHAALTHHEALEHGKI